MPKQKLLFDVSSLIYALKLKCIETLYDNYTQWLAIYEALNALWKEANLTKNITPSQAHKLASLLSEIIEQMKILSIHPHEQETLENASKLQLTIYDASYITLAEKHKLTLVTEDKKLKAKASNLISVTNLKKLTHSQPP